jgi:hypothetical protein
LEKQDLARYSTLLFFDKKMCNSGAILGTARKLKHHYFMQERGYDMDVSRLHQDNMSMILSETNGKASSSKRTKHIKVKYFFVKDKINHGKFIVKHCLTKQMWTDINTKPKQGLVFQFFQGHVMDIPENYKDADYCGNVPTSPPVSNDANLIQGAVSIEGVC